MEFDDFSCNRKTDSCAAFFARVEAVKHIFEEFLSEEETHNFSGREHSEDAMRTNILYHLKEDKTRYRKLFQGESADVFWERFKARFETDLVREAEKNKWEIPEFLPADLYWKLYVSTFVEIVKWWFKDSCRENPEQIEIYFDSFCRK